MGYTLDFGWLKDAIGTIASGAGMTLFLIAVSASAGTVLSILGAAARRLGRQLQSPLAPALQLQIDLGQQPCVDQRAVFFPLGQRDLEAFA